LILIFARPCEEKRERRKKSKCLDFDFDFVGTVRSSLTHQQEQQGETGM